MKLNLGCNDKIRPGYTNIDFDAEKKPDIVADVSKLTMIEDNSVDQIVSSHILEHFRHHQTEDVLREWKRVLKPDGLLYLSVPDFERAIEIYYKGGLQNWLIYYMYGDQTQEGNYHFTIFDETRLIDIVKKVGFKEAYRIEDMPDTLPTEANQLVSTIDFKTISLNILAIK